MTDLFYKSGHIESWGRGTLKMTEACVEAGIREPAFNVNEHSFSITFHRASSRKENVTGNVTENVTENRLEAVLTMINDNPQITTQQLAARLNVSKRTILRDIEKLKTDEKVEYVGSAKKGHWEVYE